MSELDAGTQSTPARTVADAVTEEVQQVLVGNEDAIERLTIGLLTRGHLLLEGVPGIAKTTLANLFARATGLRYQRVQMTPDTLPADITGTHVYQEQTGEFSLQRGPIFTNLLLSDEINRATPKTQSALLEAMEERQVSIGGETLPLPQPFMVVATQNPIEMEGVFELPEAQRDRFQFKLVLELPDRETEQEVLERFDTAPQLGPDDIEQVLTRDQIETAQAQVEKSYVAPPITDYILDVVRATRTHGDVRHGASPRASLAFLTSAKARAAIRGREYVIPDDVKALAESILRHRLLLTTDAELGGIDPTDVVADVVHEVELPDADPERWSEAAQNA